MPRTIARSSLVALLTTLACPAATACGGDPLGAEPTRAVPEPPTATRTVPEPPTATRAVPEPPTATRAVPEPPTAMPTPGTVMWAIALGGPGSDELRQMAVDAKGNLYIAGSTDGLLDLGAGPLTPVGGGLDAVVTRRTPAGKHVWSRRLGGPDDERIGALAVTTRGHTIAAGVTTKPGEMTSVLTGDIFVTSLDAAGKKRWSRELGGELDNILLGMVATTGGGAAVAVHTQVTEQGTVPLLDRYRTEITRLDAAGKSTWSAQVDGIVWLAKSPLAAMPDGGVVVATYLAGDGGGGPSSGPMLLTRIGADGATKWRQVFPGPCGTSPSIVSSPAGDLFVVLVGEPGAPAMDLGGGLLAPGDLLGRVGMARYAPDGAHVWSKTLVPKLVEVEGMTLTPAGDVAVLLTRGGGAPTVRIVAADGRVRTNTVLNRSDPGGLLVDRSGAILLTDIFSGRRELGASKLMSAGETDTAVFALQP